MNGKVYKPDYIKGTFVDFIFALFFLVLFIFFNSTSLLTLTILFFLLDIYSYFSLKLQSYELKEDGIFIKRGIIAKKQILIPYSETQDVQEQQNFLQRLLGIENLTIFTLAKERSGLLECLKKEDAKEIKDFILSKTKEKIKKIESVVSKKYEIHPMKKGLTIFLFLLPIFLILFLVLVFTFPKIFYVNPVVFLVIIACLIFLLFAVFYVSSIIEKLAFRLNLTEDFVSIGRVFISKEFINLPYEKIQDVTIVRGPFDRLLNMAGIIIEAGEGLIYSGAKRKHVLNKISNLYYSDAIEIKEFILRKSKIKNQKTKSLREEFPLEKRKILKKGISQTFWVLIILAIITYMGTLFLGKSLLIFLPVFSFLFFFFKIFYEFFYFKSYYYSDNEEILCLRKGVITITEVTIPYEKVQNIFVDQDLFDRIFKLYDVHLSTIGTISQMKLHIDGVSRETAENLKNWLLDRIKLK